MNRSTCDMNWRQLSIAATGSLEEANSTTGRGIQPICDRNRALPARELWKWKSGPMR